MKKVFKTVVLIVVCAVFSIAVYRFWPFISAHLFGNSASKWVTEKISESIQAQNELLVLNIETSRKETVTKEAWLIGTVQSIEIPYTFSMHYSVDMSKAKVSAEGTRILIEIPSPKPGYQKLTVDESSVHKTDWLMPLTAEDYATIKSELEEKLFQEYSGSETCMQQAKDTAVSTLTEQYSVILEKLFVNQANPYTVSVSFLAEEQ